MSQKVHSYSKDDLTIRWEPSLCAHAAKCIRSLPGVFKPQERPWIQPENATAEEIMAAIDRCPSGALRYEKAGTAVTAQEESQALRITVLENGPLRIEGPFEVRAQNGDLILKAEKASLCRCGRSANKPFCDGTHRNPA